MKINELGLPKVLKKKKVSPVFAGKRDCQVSN